MAFVKEPQHDPRDMNAHEQDDLIIYHLKRIQVLLLLITIGTLFTAGFSIRGGSLMVLPTNLFDNTAAQSAPVEDTE